MALIRTILFNILFYPGSLLYASIMLPCLVTKRGAVWGIRIWAHGVLAIVKYVLGLDYTVTMRAPFPEERAIYASKHQSAWETVALWVLVPNGIFVMKRELYHLPVIGWWIRRAGCIGLDRKAGMASVKKLMKEAKERIEEGYNIIIFPEGTRTPPGETKNYLSGITALYKYLNLPIVPIALNSGVFWPRNAFVKKPGAIHVVVLEKLPAAENAGDLLPQLQEKIETESKKLLPES